MEHLVSWGLEKKYKICENEDGKPKLSANRVACVSYSVRKVYLMLSFLIKFTSIVIPSYYSTKDKKAMNPIL